MNSAQSSRHRQSVFSQPGPNASNGRRKKRRSPRSKSPQASSTGTAGSHQAYRPGLWTWIDYVPQSKDDQTIVANIQQVFAFAEQYVNNYYLDTPKQRPCELPFFEREAFLNLPPEVSIADVLYDIAHPTTVIKHCLVALLLNSISFEGEGPVPSLLPAEFTSLARAIRNTRADDSEIQYFDAAFASSRVLAHYLRSNVNEDGCFIKVRDNAIQEIVAVFEATFAPWVEDRRDPDRRLPVLVDLLRRTSDLGILLFSQPSSFLFQWQVKDNVSRDIDIAIAPWLLKMSDENAQDIDPAQLMIRVKTEKTWPSAPKSQRKDVAHAVQNHSYDTVAPEVIIANHHGNSSSPSQTITRKALVRTGLPVTIRPSDPLPPKLSRQDSYPVHELAVPERPRADRGQLSSEKSEAVQDVGSSLQTQVYEMATTRDMTPASQGLPQNSHAHPISHITFDQGSSQMVSNESRPHTYDGASDWQQEHGRTAFPLNEAIRFPQLQPMNDQPEHQAHDSRPSAARLPPTAYRDGNGHTMVRSLSTDRGRTHTASQRARKRSISAGGPTITRAATYDPDSTDGREARILNQISLAPAQQYDDVPSGPDWSKDRQSSTITVQNPASDEHHPGRGHNGCHNFTTDIDPSRRERSDGNGTHVERHRAEDATGYSTSSRARSEPSGQVQEMPSTKTPAGKPPKSKNKLISHFSKFRGDKTQKAPVRR